MRVQSRKGDVRMKNYIFDLYGTLIDIHTNESKPSLWRNMASLLSLMGASYAPGTLKKRYRELVRSQRAERLPVMREKFGDDGLPEEDVEICLERVFEQLLLERGVEADEKTLSQTGLVFRSLSLQYIRLYEGVPGLLAGLGKAGKRVYLLSNAQRMFTEPEMRMLGIYDCFDGILYSSDAGVKKPSRHFYDTLFQNYCLEKQESVMIGNEYRADILGADAYGIRSMYVHTAQSGEKPDRLPESCRKIREIGSVIDRGGPG